MKMSFNNINNVIVYIIQIIHIHEHLQTRSLMNLIGESDKGCL